MMIEAPLTYDDADMYVWIIAKDIDDVLEYYGLMEPVRRAVEASLRSGDTDLHAKAQTLVERALGLVCMVREVDDEDGDEDL